MPGGILCPEDISAQVLAHIKSLAEKQLGQKVTRTAVTVPAYFNDGQRQATKNAAEIAGLTATLLKEPVAAAISYRLERSGDSFRYKNALVFDLSTFDVTLLTKIQDSRFFQSLKGAAAHNSYDQHRYVYNISEVLQF